MSFNLGDYTITDFSDFKMVSPTETEKERINKLEEECDNKFFSVKRIIKTVSEDEFDTFIKNYPRPLTKTIATCFDPPHISYWDKSLSSIKKYTLVADRWDYSTDPNDYFFLPKEERTGTILVNANDVYNSKMAMSNEKAAEIWDEYESKIRNIKYSGDTIVLNNVETYCLNDDTQ